MDATTFIEHDCALIGLPITRTLGKTWANITGAQSTLQGYYNFVKWSRKGLSKRASRLGQERHGSCWALFQLS